MPRIARQPLIAADVGGAIAVGIFDWGGEQMALYLGKDLGHLQIVTLNK